MELAAKLAATSHEFAGFIGVLFYLGSYFLLQTGTLRSDSYAYCIANFTAASLVMFSLLYDFNLASALIQIFWIAISILGVCRLVLSRRTSPDQQLPTSPYRDYSYNRKRYHGVIYN